MSTSTSVPFIVAFYSPSHQKPDYEGRTLDSILSFNDRQLERYHDYIQYLFPLPERSPVNPEAPLITGPVRSAFLSTPELRNQLLRALDRMLSFYGFTRTANTESKEIRIEPSGDFDERAGLSWCKRFDHNHLRITRILRCLRVLGLEAEAKAFLAALRQANDESGRRVSSTSVMFWRRAVERPLWLPPQEEDENAKGVGWLREELEGKEKGG